MNFGYTKEQERFRKEVNDWLDANVPPSSELPPEVAAWGELDAKTYAIAKEIRRKLAEKGWLHPSLPKEYGGAGLSFEEQEILLDAFSRRRIPRVYDTSALVSAGIRAYGTEEQKKKWLSPIAQGKINCWECFTEAEAGTDLGSLQTTCIRQANGDFLLNGGKIYSGDGTPVDYLYILAITDPQAPKHQNLGMFLVRADSPGVSWEPLDPIGSARKNVMHYDNVIVPAENIIGEPGNGWAVAQASLVGERGGTEIIESCQLFDELLEYCKNTERNGRRLVDDPGVREQLTELFIDAKMLRLLYYRTFWETNHGIFNWYEGPHLGIYSKLYHLKLATVARQFLGPVAIITNPKWAVIAGQIETHVRTSLELHGAGTVEALRIVFARLLDLPRPRRQ